LRIVEHRHVIPHVNSVDTQDLGEGTEVRKSSIGPEKAATTEQQEFGSVDRVQKVGAHQGGSASDRIRSASGVQS
jgi:hypothetical protein